MTLNNLASNINLSIPTVTRIINEMIDEKYIQDLGKLKTAEGRILIYTALMQKLLIL